MPWQLQALGSQPDIGIAASHLVRGPIRQHGRILFIPVMRATTRSLTTTLSRVVMAELPILVPISLRGLSMTSFPMALRPQRSAVGARPVGVVHAMRKMCSS